MDGAATHTLAAVVAAEFDRVIAAGDALAKPIKLFLFVFVGREILQWPPKGAGIKPDDGEARLGQFAGQRAAAGAGADDCKIDLVLVAVAAHRDPAAAMKNIGGAPVLGPRIIHRDALRLPTDRAG